MNQASTPEILPHNIENERLPAGNQDALHWRLLSLIFLFFFCSGAAGLIYEVLWLKGFKILFGSTAQAASSVFTAFFLGIALGSYFWGKMASRMRNTLWAYGWLELGIALSALLYFGGFPLYYRSYSLLFEPFSSQPAVFMFLKFILAFAVIFLPTFFMGGTLPVILSFLVKQPGDLAKRGSLFYSANTLGATLGAALAGFCFPLWLGFKNAYFVAIAVNTLVGLGSLALSLSQPKNRGAAEPIQSPGKQHETRPRPFLTFAAFLSGFITLALEVLWTHMFSQIFNNSVYTFGSILVTFLMALAAGALLTRLICRFNVDSGRMLFFMFLASGILTAITPFIFYRLSNSLELTASVSGWNGFLPVVFQKTLLTVGLPVLVMGMIFPYLLKLVESQTQTRPGLSHQTAGPLTGHLLAVNTVGAVLGSLLAGFFLLKALGLWASLRLMACLYVLPCFWLVKKPGILAKALILLPAIGWALFFTILNPAGLPLIKLDSQNQSKLLDLWEGNYGTIAVIRSNQGLVIRSNNHFALGGEFIRDIELTMGDLPLLLHPRPKSAFFQGMGTGITAGAALHHPSIEKVTICELVPEIRDASKKYFGTQHRLFEDPRARVVTEDARNYLLGTKQTYDVIVSDLFFPFEAGAGSLYTREHFTSVLRHLNPNGLFAQWLPFYQLSETEFRTIAKTMLDVFPQVTIWRANFSAARPVVALIGHREAASLDGRMLIASYEHFAHSSSLDPRVQKVLPFLYYAGNLTSVKSWFDTAAINTDDRPWVEYLAPISHANSADPSRTVFFTHENLLRFYEILDKKNPVDSDPYLKSLSETERNAVKAGQAFYLANVLALRGRQDLAQQAIQAVCSATGSTSCDLNAFRLRQTE